LGWDRGIAYSRFLLALEFVISARVENLQALSETFLRGHLGQNPVGFEFVIIGNVKEFQCG
jgi:hypothetical protein